MLSCSPIHSGGWLNRSLDNIGCQAHPCLLSGSRAEHYSIKSPEQNISHKRASGAWLRTSTWSRQSCCTTYSARRPDYAGDVTQQRKSILLQYVSTVQPSVIEKFAEQAPAPVVRAMQETVKNMVGTLPPQFFTVTISTMGDNLQQLMYSVLLTGYMFRNAQYRMELRSSLGPAASLPASTTQASLPSSTSASGNGSSASSDKAGGFMSGLASFAFGKNGSSTSSSSGSTTTTTRSASAPAAAPTSSAAADAATSSKDSTGGSSSTSGSADDSGSRRSSGALALSLSSTDEEDSAYAPGVQKSDIDGQVLRWHKENGLERMSASQYIELLEQEVVRLRQAAKLAAAASPAARPVEPHTELLEYLKAQEAQGLQELTSGASPEILEAANAFIARMMGTASRDALRSQASDCTAAELAQMLLWLLVVGYTLRSLEVRMDVNAAMDVPLTAASILELPPGH